MADFARLLKHLFVPDATSRFGSEDMDQIAAAIAAGEARHRGEICFAVEGGLDWREVLRGVSARDRAVDAFGRLKVWDTASNNGVLIYLLLADHRIEIVADRGLDALVSTEQWRGICVLMEERLRADHHADAVVAGVEAISDILAAHFPQRPGEVDVDELPNRPHLL